MEDGGPLRTEAPVGQAAHDGVSKPRYKRHRAEETVLCRTLSTHSAEFCQRAEEAEGLPGFVARGVEEYLRCGPLEYGCVRVGYERCGFERLVASSSERRGFCPSWLGRRSNNWLRFASRAL